MDYLESITFGYIPDVLLVQYIFNLKGIWCYKLGLARLHCTKWVSSSNLNNRTLKCAFSIFSNLSYYIQTNFIVFYTFPRLSALYLSYF